MTRFNTVGARIGTLTLSSADLVSKSTFMKNYFRNTIRVSNSLDLGPNCFKRLSAADTTVKTVLSSHSKRRQKIGCQDRLSLNAGQKYCRMLQESILQYFQPSLSYHLSLRPLFCLVLSGR